MSTLPLKKNEKKRKNGQLSLTSSHCLYKKTTTSVESLAMASDRHENRLRFQIMLDSNFEFTLDFRWVRIDRSLVFCAVFCRSLFVLWSVFRWSLHCLCFYMRLLITPFGIFKLLLDTFYLFSKGLNHPDLRARSISSFYLTTSWDKLLTRNLMIFQVYHEVISN